MADTDGYFELFSNFRKIYKKVCFVYILTDCPPQPKNLHIASEKIPTTKCVDMDTGISPTTWLPIL